MYGLLMSAVFSSSTTLRIWTDLNRDLCRAAMSWYICSTASTRDIALYSLYMLCVPDRESYLNQRPKFLTLSGLFSWIALTDTISPDAFFNLRICLMKYQNRDSATTEFGANSLILYSLGTGAESVGSARATTQYSVSLVMFVYSSG